jgi:hypothetical protein
MRERLDETRLAARAFEHDADSAGWGWGAFEYDAASDTFRPATVRTIRRRNPTRRGEYRMA